MKKADLINLINRIEDPSGLLGGMEFQTGGPDGAWYPYIEANGNGYLNVGVGGERRLVDFAIDSVTGVRYTEAPALADIEREAAATGAALIAVLQTHSLPTVPADLDAFLQELFKAKNPAASDQLPAAGSKMPDSSKKMPDSVTKQIK